METCGFDVAWVGHCKKEKPCNEHKNEKCRCGSPAIKQCDNTIISFVCGTNLCGSCKCDICKTSNYFYNG